MMLWKPNVGFELVHTLIRYKQIWHYYGCRGGSRPCSLHYTTLRFAPLRTLGRMNNYLLYTLANCLAKAVAYEGMNKLEACQELVNFTKKKAGSYTELGTICIETETCKDVSTFYYASPIDQDMMLLEAAEVIIDSYLEGFDRTIPTWKMQTGFPLHGLFLPF